MKKFGIKVSVSTLLLAVGVAVPMSLSSCSAPENAQLAIGGAEMWQNNCSRCHNFRDPGIYNDEQWSLAMQHMRVRGGLTGEEHDKILQFLQSAN